MITAEDEIERIAKVARITVDRKMEKEIADILRMFEALEAAESSEVERPAGMSGPDRHEKGGEECEEKAPKTV